jgi:hypothetical protein
MSIVAHVGYSHIIFKYQQLSQYSARLGAHPNDLIVNLIELPDNRRLRRHLPNDLPPRFLVQLLYL